MLSCELAGGGRGRRRVVGCAWCVLVYGVVCCVPWVLGLGCGLLLLVVVVVVC